MAIKRQHRNPVMNEWHATDKEMSLHNTAKQIQQINKWQQHISTASLSRCLAAVPAPHPINDPCGLQSHVCTVLMSDLYCGCCRCGKKGFKNANFKHDTHRLGLQLCG